MANSIKFMNEGFSKYENIKPSFEDCLYEAMKSLTERKQEWSDEDKKDNELLWSIFDKRQERSNAKLTPEEQNVLKKYDIEDPYNFAPDTRYHYADKRVVAKTSPTTNLFDNEVQSLGRNTKYNTKVNLADRARKQKSRYLAKKDADKYSQDSTNKVNSMKNELRNRKYYNNELNDVDSRYNKRIKDLEAERDSKKDRYSKYVSDSQSKINKLLKRESLKEDYEYPDITQEDIQHEIEMIYRAIAKVKPESMTVNELKRELSALLQGAYKKAGGKNLTFSSFQKRESLKEDYEYPDITQEDIQHEIEMIYRAIAKVKPESMTVNELKRELSALLQGAYKKAGGKNLTFSSFQKRESLKEDNYSNKYGGSKEDYISDIEDMNKVLRDISSNIATLGAEEIIQDFIEQLESLKNSALNESLNKRTSLKK